MATIIRAPDMAAWPRSGMRAPAIAAQMIQVDVEFVITSSTAKWPCSRNVAAPRTRPKAVLANTGRRDRRSTAGFTGVTIQRVYSYPVGASSESSEKSTSGGGRRNPLVMKIR